MLLHCVEYKVERERERDKLFRESDRQTDTKENFDMVLIILINNNLHSLDQTSYIFVTTYTQENKFILKAIFIL